MFLLPTLERRSSRAEGRKEEAPALPARLQSQNREIIIPGSRGPMQQITSLRLCKSRCGARYARCSRKYSSSSSPLFFASMPIEMTSRAVLRGLPSFYCLLSRGGRRGTPSPTYGYETRCSHLFRVAAERPPNRCGLLQWRGGISAVDFSPCLESRNRPTSPPSNNFANCLGGIHLLCHQHCGLFIDPLPLRR